MNSIKTAIREAEIVAICSHLNPDGDNLGSLLALTKTLRNLGKTVYPLQYDRVPKKYGFLPLVDSFTDEEYLPADLLITVDCADIERLGPVDKIMEGADTVINIDHHKTNEEYGDINRVRPDKSSTCEIVFDLLKELEFPIDEDTATLLFTGLITDTNRFLYESADEDTLACGAELVGLGADKALVMEKIYQSDRLEGKKLVYKILAETRFYGNDKIAVNHILREDLKKRNLEFADIDWLVNEFRDTEEVEVSVLLKEKADRVFKISLRSTGIDVSEIAAAFGGGGHTFAAGCEIEGRLDEVEKKIVREIERHGL